MGVLKKSNSKVSEVNLYLGEGGVSFEVCAVSNGDGAYREEADTLPTDMSDTSDSEPDNKHNDGECVKCPNPHDGKLIMQQQFPFNIDQMFTMIFTNCQFNVELRDARSTTNYDQSPWQAQDGLECRQIKYTIPVTAGGPLGPKEAHVTEMQVMNKCSKPGALYSIDCTSDNSGIPYADYFSVCAHYCLQRVTHSSTMFSLYGHLKYKKSTLFKSFIEKNSINGLYEFCQKLESKLNALAKGAAPTSRKSREHRRHTGSYGTSSQQLAAPASNKPPRVSTRWLVTAVLLLLGVNALLYWTLRSEQRTPDLNDLQNRLISIQSTQTAEWSRLLERHSARQRDQLARWREALHTTIQHVAQTEEILTKLLETMRPSLESAQREAEAYTRSGEL